jgi:hypothetical protein
VNLRLLRVLFVLIGVLVLILGGQYSGPAETLVHSYGSNIAFSFAAYFLFQLTKWRIAERRSWAVGVIFIGDSLQEIAQGLGFMTGVFDPWDFFANAVGIAIAFAVDWLVRGTGTSD